MARPNDASKLSADGPSTPPAELSPTSAAILGLLAQRPWTTYELAKQMQRSIRWFWQRAERKLYDEPKALVSWGYASAEPGATGKRPKTVYRITPQGRAALRDWLDAESNPPVFEVESLLRVFFAECGSADQLRTTIDRIARQAEADRLALQHTAETRSTDDPMVARREPVNALSIRLVLDLHRAIEDWAAWAAGITRDWESTTDPPWTGEDVFGPRTPAGD